MELLSLIPVIGFALGWQRWQNTTAAAAMLHAVSAMLLVLFLASLVGWLQPITILLMVAGAMFAVIEGVRCVRWHRSFPVPMGVFAFLCIVYWAIQSGSLYYYYDEYSHWGVFLKEMLARNQLWGADTNSMHPRYLPGTSLWQYFFAVYSERPEGAAYLAQFSLLLTPLLVLWEKTDWCQTYWHFGILAVVIIAVSNFGHGLTSLYVDHVLGAWFAGVLLNILLEIKSRSMWRLTSYLLPLAVIVLVKSTGVFFALACAGTITLLLADRVGGGAVRRWTGPWLRRVVFFPAAAIVLCLFILISWSSNRNANSLEDTGGSTRNVASRLFARESIFDAPEQAELTRRFIDVILHQQISKDELSGQYNAFSYPLMPLYTDRFRLTTVSFLGFSLLAMILLWRTSIPPENRRSWAIATGCIWLTTIAYIGLLYLGYRYISGDRNGFQLSSYIRYAHSMLMPVLVFCFAGLVPAFAEQNGPRVKLAPNLAVGRHTVVFFLALSAFAVFERPYLKPLYSVQRPPAIRLQLDPLTEQVRSVIGEARLWVFFPNNVSNGFIGRMLQYQLSPGRTYIEEDADVLLGDQEALQDELRNWEYAWFAPQNPELDVALQRLLGTAVTARVFKIASSSDSVVLEPVEGVFRPARAGK